MRIIREILWASGVYLARFAVVGGFLQFVAWITDRTNEIVNWVKDHELWFYKLLIAGYVVSVIADILRIRLLDDGTTKAPRRPRR